jgi:predicted signal transduction protein with EAL and GGDEF domain
MLKELECDELQGYLIARPMPASEIEAFLANNGSPVLAQDRNPMGLRRVTNG